MKYALLFILAVSALAVPPTPVGVATEFLSHSSVSFTYGVSSVSPPVSLRIRYGTASCSAGTGGTLQVSLNSGITLTGNRQNLAGLAPSTAYHACLELSNDGGSTWSTGNDLPFTTAALPAVHPAKPIAPLTFDTSYPNTTGFATYNVLADCSDFGTGYNAAVARQATQGTVINVPAGTVCSPGAYAFGTLPPSPGILSFLPANVNTSNGQINITGHGMSEGDLIQFSREYAAHDIYPATTSCPDQGGPGIGGGIYTGVRYSVHFIDANNFQVYCTDGSTLMAFTTAGTVSGAEHFYLTPWTLVNGLWTTRLKPIIIRSATADSALPPPGVQITPAWQSKMASFVDPAANLGLGVNSGAFFLFGDRDANFERPVGSIRIGPGIEITTDDSVEAHTSSDPTAWQAIIKTFPQNANIIFDRVYVHGQGTPNRINAGMYWDGSNLGIVDSYFTNLVFYHNTSTGLVIAQAGAQTFTVASGNVNTGAVGALPLAAVSGTISGAGSGEVLLGFDLAHGNTFTAWNPASVTTACTGVACATGTGAGSTNGTCKYSDGWPKDSLGNPTAVPVACFTVVSGSITAVIQGDSWSSNYGGEGCQCIIAGIGPGPYVVLDDYFEGAGLILHHDDSGLNRPRGDYTYFRDYFHMPLKYMQGPAINGNTASDGLDYASRQCCEWKGGQRQLIKGNVFDTTWTDVIPTGLFIVETPRHGGNVTDVEMVSNTFKHGSGVTANPYTICTTDPPCAQPSARFWFHNNSAYDISINYAAHNQVYNENSQGWLLGSGGESTEDTVWDHNTFGGVHTGALPIWLDWDEYPTEGWQFTNNIFDVTGIPTQRTTGAQSTNVAIQTCAAIAADKTFMDCAFTSGPGNTLYNFSGNVILGGYTDASATPSGQISTSTLNTLFGTLTTGGSNTAVAGANVPATIAAVKWWQPNIASAPNFRLRNDSSYVAGNSPYGKSADAGANMDLLAVDQGELTLISVTPIATTSATVNYIAADSGVCYVDASSTDPNVITSFTRFTDAGGNRVRNLALTGLTTGTSYNFRVECSGNAVVSQRMGKFMTR